MSAKDNRGRILSLHDDAVDTALGIICDDSRYCYDNALLQRGWKQYDTDQDAWYFGVWVSLETFQIMTYAEGDRYLEQYADKISFKTELDRLETVYGPVPPAFIGFDLEAGTRTEYISPRPALSL